MQDLKQSTAFTFRIGPFLDETDGKTAETGLTIVQADIQISKAGGAFAQTSDATPTTTHDTDGWYQCPLTATDTGTLGLLDVQIHVAGALPVWRHFSVLPANVFDSMYSTDKLQVDVTQLGGVTQSATDLKDFADAGYDPATNKVEGVKLADTTTTNTDMAGTNSAALASVCTEARLAELDSANLPTDVDAILADTDSTIPNRLTNIDGALSTIDTIVDAILVDTAELQETARYIGSRGLGVFLDDGAANTNTVVGVDGIESNPVSTIAAATTIAGSLGVQRIYLVNDSVITLAQTYEGWEFVGIGLGNQITLGSQDVDNSSFFFLTLTGTQGGTGLLWCQDCSMTGLVSLECIAFCCYLTGTNTVRASSLIIFHQCLSAVPGNATPELTFSGGATSIQFRHYSGGLQLNSMGTGDTMSYESDGQIIVDASCTDGLLTVRGCCDVTDNASGAVAITQSAAINQANINAEVDAALNTAIPGSPTADSINERIQSLDDKATAVVDGAFTGTPTTTTGNTDLTGFAADVFIDRYIYITSGTYQGEFAKITDYVVASGVLTYEALSGAPANTDTFVIA